MSAKNLNQTCMSCFADLPVGGAHCPVCGYDQSSPLDSPYQLPLRTILNGKYLVGKTLGEGGFGITYTGYDLNLDIKVAIKEYYPSGFVSRTNSVSATVQTYGGEQGEVFAMGRDRFVDEAKRLARFRSLTGIVMVNDFFVENGTAYIVMEYIEGQTLKSYLAAAGGKMPPAQIFEMMGPVFSSLSQIHEGGLIHRDISPDNIMITPKGDMKLLDFGAAREFGSDNKSLSVMLKHGYAPTEQYQTRGIQGPQTDVYALAATLYKAITGITPDSSMDRVFEDKLLPPSQLGVGISAEQEAALLKGMAVRQEMRFQTMGEFYTALMSGGGLAGQGSAPPPYIQEPYVPPQQPGHAVPAPPPVMPPQHSQAGIPVPSSMPDTPAPMPAAPKEKKPPSPHRNKIIGGAVAAAIVIAFAIGLSNLSDSPNDGASQIAAEELATPAPPADDIPDSVVAQAPADPDPHTADPSPSVAPEPEPLPLQGGGALSSGGEAGNMDVSAWEGMRSVAAGWFHVLGLRYDGTVDAAGMNDYWQCDVSDWSSVIDVGAGMYHSVGLKSDGTVVSVGRNDEGQGDVSGWRNIVAIAVGDNHTVGLRSDGAVITAGRNEIGQGEVSGWYDIVAISAGGFHTMGLRSDGRVVATGSDEFGQCDVSSWRDIVAISAGYHHSVGLRADGTVVTAGANDHGNHDVREWRNIVAIGAGAFHTIGLRPDGTLVAVGSNLAGESNISEWADVSAIAAGYLVTVAISEDDQVLFPLPRPTIPTF